MHPVKCRNCEKVTEYINKSLIRKYCSVECLDNFREKLRKEKLTRTVTVKREMTVNQALAGASAGRQSDKAIRNTLVTNLKGKELFKSLKIGQAIRVTKHRESYRGQITQKYPHFIKIDCSDMSRSLNINDFMTNEYKIEIIS